MPTTTKKATAVPAGAAVVGAPDTVDASVGGDTPTPTTVIVAEVEGGDPPEVPASELNDPDPRSAALASLLTQAPPVLSDAGPRPAQRIMPRLTGRSESWHSDGDWYLVWASVYARIIDGDRLQLRPGDLVRVRDDDRTQADVALGYLVPHTEA